MKTIWKQLRRYVDGDRSTSELLTLTDPQVIADFKKQAARLRTSKPVCPVSTGGVLLLDPADVKSAFSDPALSNQPSRFSALAAKNKDRYTAASVASNILPFLDGPQHLVLRKWASRGFFKQLREFEGQIPDIAVQHCQSLDSGTAYVLVEDIARRFVVDVIGRFIGIELEPDEMKQCTSSLFRLFAPASDPETFARTNENLDFARERLREALLARRIDQTSCLINTLDATFPPELSEDDKDLVIIDNALLFLADGVENVEAAIGVVMMRYAQSSGPITTEFVRQSVFDDTPGQTIARIASRDMTIGNETLAAGTPVFLSLSSANDAAEAGDEFTFGRGRHKCLGENLAVAMVQAFCTQIAARKPTVNSEKLTYRAMFGHKWPRGITLVLAEEATSHDPGAAG